MTREDDIFPITQCQSIDPTANPKSGGTTAQVDEMHHAQQTDLRELSPRQSVNWPFNCWVPRDPRMVGQSFLSRLTKQKHKSFPVGQVVIEKPEMQVFETTRDNEPIRRSAFPANRERSRLNVQRESSFML
jgi:hypothetical protein